MTVEKIICDECGRAKAEANHWHQIGVIKWDAGGAITIELGNLTGGGLSERTYSVRDLCGEQCFHKHIAKLLGFNPPTTFEEVGKP